MWLHRITHSLPLYDFKLCQTRNSFHQWIHKVYFLNELYLKYILCVGMFVLLEILFLVWKLVQIAFSLKEKETPVFMPDALVFEYSGLERSNFKNKVQSNILFLISTSQVTGKYKAKYKAAIRPLSKCNCNPQEEEDTPSHTHTHTQTQDSIFSALFHQFDHIYQNILIAALCIAVTSCVTLENSIFLMFSSYKLLIRNK